MLINPPANICLRLVYHICNKSTNLHNILVYCKHTGMWYKYFDIHMTAYINMFAPSNVLMKYASPSGWYYSAAPMLWCQAVIKYVNTSRGPSAFGRSTKLNDKAIIWPKPQLGVDTHQMDTMIGERLQTKPQYICYLTLLPQLLHRTFMLRQYDGASSPSLWQQQWRWWSLCFDRVHLHDGNEKCKKISTYQEGGWGGGRQELPTIFYMSEQHDNDLTIQRMSLESICLL